MNCVEGSRALLVSMYFDLEDKDMGTYPMEL
jgi:hypothetical protein